MKEKLSLLELAVWKSTCLVRYAEDIGSSSQAQTVTMQDIEDYWALDESFNPIQYRKRFRMNIGISAIVENVLPFLGSSF